LTRSRSGLRRRALESFDRILIFNTAFPGDLVLTTPLLRAVYESFPGAYIGVCTTSAGARLLSGSSYLDRLLLFEKHARDRGPAGVLRAALSLRTEKFDLVLCPHRSFRSAMLLALAGIPERVGFDSSQGRWLYTRLAHRDSGSHETRRNLELLAPLGINPEGLSTHPFLPVTGEEANHVFGMLGVGLPKGPGPLVLVAPGSVWGTKRWLPERFAELIDGLYESRAARVLLAGGPADRGAADEVLARVKAPCYDLVGRTDLRLLAALVRKADLVVCGDSAPMHIAWAFDKPTVAIFGATTPALGFAPLSERCLVVEVSALECRPCSAHGPQTCPLGHFHCMRQITARMVLEACEKALALGPAR